MLATPTLILASLIPSIKSQPYSPNGQEVASADLSPQNLYHYYAKGNVGDMPIKQPISLKDLWISMKQNMVFLNLQAEY